MKTQIYVKTKCNGKHFIIPVLEAGTGGSLGLAGQQSAVLMNPRPVKHSQISVPKNGIWLPSTHVHTHIHVHMDFLQKKKFLRRLFKKFIVRTRYLALW